MEPARSGPAPVADGTRLVHIGPHKTGTTSLQAAFWAARDAALAQGVRYAGSSRHPVRAVQAITQRPSTYSEETPPPIREWNRLAREIRSAREPRVLVSSELFAWATPDTIQRIVRDIGGSPVHVVVTLRPLAKIIPSMWQQGVQSGHTMAFNRWVSRLLADPSGADDHPFWTLHRHDLLIERWADVVGPASVTVIVVDDRDRGAMLRSFEGLTGLRDGTLPELRDHANRSLTLQEAEAVRAFNVAFRERVHDKGLHARLMRLGAAEELKARTPAEGEAVASLPAGAAAPVAELASQMATRISASGVRIIGDLAGLAVVPEPAGTGSAGRVTITPEVATSLVNAVRVAVGDARGTAPDGGVTTAAIVPGYQLAAVIAMRTWDSVATRIAEMGRRARRGRAPSPAEVAREASIEVEGGSATGAVPPEVAARMAMAVVAASGVIEEWARRPPFLRYAEPPEVLRLSTGQITGLILRRLVRGATRRGVQVSGTGADDRAAST